MSTVRRYGDVASNKQVRDISVAVGFLILPSPVGIDIMDLQHRLLVLLFSLEFPGVFISPCRPPRTGTRHPTSTQTSSSTMDFIVATLQATSPLLNSIPQAITNGLSQWGTFDAPVLPNFLDSQVLSTLLLFYEQYLTCELDSSYCVDCSGPSE